MAEIMKRTDEQVGGDVREAIERVLAHTTRVDADAFEVEAANPEVTLHGSVRSRDERPRAPARAPSRTAVKLFGGERARVT
jgi:osmotically-inducible protein OsmY